MTIDNYEFQNIKSFLKENNFILSNDLPRKVGNGQSNPTYILTDNENKKFILRTQPKGDLVRGAHRLDREFNVLRGLTGMNLISADVVEVSPAYDHAEVTSLAAATIVYELTNLFAKKKL